MPEDKIIVRPGTGKRAAPGIWEVAKTGGGKFDLILACYSNWTKEDCERYAEYQRQADEWMKYFTETGKMRLPIPSFTHPQVSPQ